MSISQESAVICPLVMIESRSWLIFVLRSVRPAFERITTLLNLVKIADKPPVSHNTYLRDVQIGFPELPVAASETHLKILKEWIADCDHNHECYSEANTFIPTRLLDIRNKGSGNIQLLVNNQAHSRFRRYATLSHRWGSPQQHRFCTYKSNIEELQQGIKISDLPRTFQDAVRVAYGLGLQYLWIDSLCIIQDDPLDWDTESKLMERVF